MKKPDFKDDGLIPQTEADYLLTVYEAFKNKQFYAQDAADVAGVSYSLMARILRAGLAYGVLKISVYPMGKHPAKYTTKPVKNVNELVYSKVRRQTIHKKPSPWKREKCMLADVMGLKPIQHDVTPRVVINDFRGGKIERQPQKNYVATSWMVGL